MSAANTTNKALLLLWRYKFTLLYTALFGYAGGLALGVPAILCGLLVDFLMTRPNIKEPDYGTKMTAGYVFAVVMFFLILYPFFAFFSGWLWLWSSFTDAMAQYIPAINRYGEIALEKGEPWRVERLRHLFAMYWFVSLVFVAPFLGGDIARWVRLMVQNKLFVDQVIYRIPGSIGTEVLNVNSRYCLSLDNRRHIIPWYMIMFLLLLSFCAALYFSIGISFHGPYYMGDYVYAGGKYMWSPFFTVVIFIGFVMVATVNSLMTIRLIYRWRSGRLFYPSAD